MYALVDCNNFYVSCEKLFNPGLRNKPVIVLSNNDGCAISRSDEAKALGIKMGAAPHLMQDLLKNHQVKMFSSNYVLYGDMSDRVMKTLLSFVPRMEIYSIDEAFLDMNNMVQTDLQALGITIRETVLQHMGIPTCVGIAPTKTLAKMANHYAKKNFKTTGIYYAGNKEAISRMLADAAVGDIWGVGQQYALLLQENNIHTAMDFVNAPEDFIRRSMSVVGLRIQKELKGIPCLELQTTAAAKKIIGSSRSFGALTSDINVVKEALSNYTAIAALKLRNQQCVAGSLKVFVHTNPFRKQDEQYYQSVNVTLERASSNTAEIIKYAFRGLELIFRPGFNYLKCGIELGNIVPESEVQMSLFSQESGNDKSGRAINALDKINKNFGRELVRFGIQGRQQVYKARANHLSKCYTTRPEDFIRIKI